MAQWPLRVINIISSVRRALPVCPRLRTYRCVAANDVKGQKGKLSLLFGARSDGCRPRSGSGKRIANRNPHEDIPAWPTQIVREGIFYTSTSGPSGVAFWVKPASNFSIRTIILGAAELTLSDPDLVRLGSARDLRLVPSRFLPAAHRTQSRFNACKI